MDTHPPDSKRLRVCSFNEVSSSGGLQHDGVKQVSYSDIIQYTNNFSEDSLIGKFQWGKVYRGLIGAKKVIVKKWEDPGNYNYFEGDNVERLGDEINLLPDPKVSAHPNLVKLIGYCDANEEQLAAIYDVNPRDSLFNLIPEDSFTWQQRIKVILGFARALQFMHASNPPYLIRNISADHVIVDMDYNAQLIDFGMISGGMFPDRRSKYERFFYGCYGYVNFDPHAPGLCSEKVDVCAFGTVLLMSISKRVLTEKDLSDQMPYVYEWAEEVYVPRESGTKFTLVHETLQESQDFCNSDGDKLETLAMRCVDYYNIKDRPTMEEVVKELLELSVVQAKSM